MKIVLLLLITGCTAQDVFLTNKLAGLKDLPDDMDWETFQSVFGKNYNGKEAEARKAAFKENRAFIIQHNAEADNGKHTFRCGVNSFSDLTQAEYRKQYLGYVASQYTSVAAVQMPRGQAPPASVDWRSSGAVTPIKNQGSCGSCWSFSATGSLEGHYKIATGALRSLSEQQLIDCSRPEGNLGCGGGAMTAAFDYIIANKGIDNEDEYGYTAQDSEPCWTAAEKRVVATLSNYTNVPQGKEDELAAAAALGPVSVAIEADQAGFQNYKSGIFSAACGTKLDHGVLVVGYTADHWIVKNSWGTTWGEQGFIRMKRGVNICGIAQDASYPNVAKAAPVPVPPPTPGPRPSLPCNCTSSCQQMCGQFGMWCCDGTGGNCDCSSPGSCPQCNPHPPDGPYARCKDASSCQAGAECVNINGIDGNICMPACTGYGRGTCPDPSDKEQATARPYCDACITASGKDEKPNACILVCNATSNAQTGLNGQPVYDKAECQTGSTCKPLTLDKDPCDNGSKWPAGAHPCQATKTCGVCTFP